MSIRQITTAILPITLSSVCLAQVIETVVPPWPPRGYACLRTVVDIRIDGDIDADEWDHAPWTESFTDILGDRRPAPRYRTRAKMLWDDDYFYLAAELEEPHVWATLTGRDSVIFHDNDFEVFIDPDADTHLYNEIEINALNTVWDLLLVRTYDDGGPAVHAWDIPGLQTAVRVQGSLNEASDIDAGWTVEMAIPWQALAETAGVKSPPETGDRWRVNFSRVQWRLAVVDGRYVKSTSDSGAALPEDNWVWSEQRAVAMHEPEYWGIVEFRDDSAAPAVEATDTDRAAWRLRQVFNALRTYRLSNGIAPQSLHDLDQSPGFLRADELLPGWTWPPTYTATEDRWILELSRTDGSASIRMTEDGRIERRK